MQGRQSNLQKMQIFQELTVPFICATLAVAVPKGTL